MRGITRTSRLFLLTLLLLLLPCLAHAQEYFKVIEEKGLDALTEEAKWTAGGGPEAAVATAETGVLAGTRALAFTAKIDLQGPAGARYPAGWPSCQTVLQPPLDWSGWDAIAFRIRVDAPAGQKTAVPKLFPIRFILHTDGKNTLNKPLKAFGAGEWVEARFDLSKVPNLDKVTLVHLFLCEDQYPDGLEMTFTVDDFRLQKTQPLDQYIPPNECTVALHVDENEDWTLLDSPVPEALPGILKLTTGAECPLRADDRIAWTATNIFTRQRTTAATPLGQEAVAGGTSELPGSFPLKSLAPGYYLLTADVVRGGKSLCGGRVGADDFYIKRPGESMAYTALCMRLGAVEWITDKLYGGLTTHGSIILPHTYDPLNRDAYLLWLRQWCTDCGKNTEGLEAGVTGLVFACEALRRVGDKERLAYAENLLENTLTYMIDGMQDPDGGARTVVNELMENHGEALEEMGWGTSSRDSNQTGEWVRPIARAVTYFRNIKGREQTAQKLLKACTAAADFIVRNSTDKVGDREHVLRHYHFAPYSAASPEPIKRTIYHQEGRQCEVYMGRAMAGVSYVAYAMALCGQKPPETWLTMLRETTAWATERMAPHDGWFDWGCEDVVEGGCHTFLGNMYIGEGTMGHYLVEKELGNEREAQAAAEATHMAYRYVTDHCTIRGRRFGIPSELWVGPYLYWELLEYNTHVAPDPVFAEWLQGITDQYVEKTQWKGFSQRGKPPVGRGGDNGSLVTSILGWLGLHVMDEIGQPWGGYETMGGG